MKRGRCRLFYDLFEKSVIDCASLAREKMTKIIEMLKRDKNKMKREKIKKNSMHN